MYPINMNDPTVQPGRVTASDIDERQRERAAVLEIAAQLDKERRFGIWPPTRPAPLTPAADDNDADGLGGARGIVVVFAAVLLVGLCIVAGFGLSALFKTFP